MAYFGLIFAVVGLVGLFMGTAGGSALAALLPRRSRRPSAAGMPARLKLEILVAAHNEESVIRATLESLTTAADRLRASVGDVFDLRITVGLDHCTDKSAELVEAFARCSSNWSVRGIENPLTGSKWNNLRTLVGQADADWVALVDCGSIWESDLLVAAWTRLIDSSIVGISPSYSPKGAGGLERLNWKFERALKGLENRAGGPVSVHGATVLYRLAPLRQVLRGVLSGTQWFNDDVAVPLSLRLTHPELRLVYLDETPASGAPGWVRDVGVVSDLDVEFRRRRRMVVGNVQWIQGLWLPRLLAADPRATLIASRRVFRLFWAYWVLSLGLGAFFVSLATAMSIETSSFRSFAICGVGALFAALPAALYVRSNWVRRLFMAFVSGLLVPRFWFQDNGVRGISWV